MKSFRFLLCVVCAVAVLAGAGVFAAEEDPFEDVLAELTEQLGLSEEQQGEVADHLMTLGTGLEAATAEADAEEPDTQKMIGDLKKVRDEFNSSMKKTLDKDQFAKFEAAVDATLQDMFNDIAAIRIMDLQPALDLTDEQAAQLEPIVGTGLRGILSLAIENADKRLTLPRKASLGRSMKKIQSDMEKGIAGVLSEEQMAKYQAMKESQE